MSVDSNGPNLQRLIDATLGDSFYSEQVAFLRAFDGMAQPAVLDKDSATPPGAPANGDRYIIAANPTGAWVGRATQIARYYTSQVGNGWEFWTPKVGWRVAVVDEADSNGQPLSYSFDGSKWGQPSGGMTNPMTTAGDLILGGSGGAPGRLAVGAALQFLGTKVNGSVGWISAVGSILDSNNVNTGALMEYGSNSNGMFFKFANGLLVCLLSQTGYTAGSPKTNQLPATFVDSFNGMGGGITPNDNWDFDWSAYATSTQWLMNSKNTFLNNVVKLIAVGRWK